MNSQMKLLNKSNIMQYNIREFLLTILCFKNKHFFINKSLCQFFFLPFPEAYKYPSDNDSEEREIMLYIKHKAVWISLYIATTEYLIILSKNKLLKNCFHSLFYLLTKFF